MKYVAIIGRRTSPKCLYCPLIDDAEHTLFSCPKWSREKQELELCLGWEVNVGNLVECMLSKAEAWERIQTYMRNINENKRGGLFLLLIMLRITPIYTDKLNKCTKD